LPHPSDHVLRIRARLHDVRLDQVAELVEHGAHPRVDEVVLVQFPARQPLLCFELAAQQLRGDRVALGQPPDVDRAQLVEDREVLGVHRLDRRGIARREPIVIAVIAERGRPGRRPLHREFPVVGQHGAQRGVCDACDRICSQRRGSGRHHGVVLRGSCRLTCSTEPTSYSEPGLVLHLHSTRAARSVRRARSSRASPACCARA